MFEIVMGIDDFLIQLVKYCIYLAIIQNWMEGFKSSSGSASTPLNARVCKRSKLPTKKYDIPSNNKYLFKIKLFDFHIIMKAVHAATTLNNSTRLWKRR